MSIKSVFFVCFLMIVISCIKCQDSRRINVLGIRPSVSLVKLKIVRNIRRRLISKCCGENSCWVESTKQTTPVENMPEISTDDTTKMAETVIDTATSSSSYVLITTVPVTIVPSSSVITTTIKPETTLISSTVLTSTEKVLKVDTSTSSTSSITATTSSASTTTISGTRTTSSTTTVSSTTTTLATIFSNRTTSITTSSTIISPASTSSTRTFATSGTSTTNTNLSTSTASLSTSTSTSTRPSTITTTSNTSTSTPSSTSTITSSSTSTTTTTAATTTVPCPTCPDIYCTTDPSKFNSATNELIDPLSYGEWKNTCDRLYLFNNRLALSQTDAMKYCCMIGMRLLALETEVERQCLLRLNNVDTRYSDRFWTGLILSKTECQDNRRWCSNDNTPLHTDVLSWENALDTKVTSICVELYLTPTVAKVNDLACSDKRNFICEGEVTTCIPPCPSYNCVTDPSLVDSAGNIKVDRNTLGLWRDICGKKYMITNKLMTSVENMEYCCSLGLEALSFLSLDDFLCFADNIGPAVEPTDRDISIWTSAVRKKECTTNTVRYCSDKNKTTTYYDNKWWPNQPDSAGGNEWCVNIYYRRIKADTSYNDIPCTNNLVTACMAPPAP